MTWNAEKKQWLVIVTRGDLLQWRRDKSLRAALVAAVEGLKEGEAPARSGVLD